MIKPIFRIPSARCSPLILRYIFLNNDNREVLYDKFISDGYAAIVFHFKGKFHYSEKQKIKTLPKIFISTPIFCSLDIEAHYPGNSMIAVCKTSVFSRIFKINLAQDSKTPYKILKPFIDYPIWKMLKEASRDEDKIQIFEDYLIKHFLQDHYIPDEIDLLYDKIISLYRSPRIKDILHRVNINPRTLRRIFLKRVGLSMKKFIGLLRINHVFELVRNNPGLDLQTISFNCHYFDQAHFIKDFKKIISETPHSFFKRDLRTVEFFSGKAPTHI